MTLNKMPIFLVSTYLPYLISRYELIEASKNDKESASS